MFKKLIKFTKSCEFLGIALLLFVVVLISYGKTLNMYWWIDDSGILFKMVHPLEAAGNLGAGIFGGGAYRFLATPFTLLCMNFAGKI